MKKFLSFLAVFSIPAFTMASEADLVIPDGMRNESILYWTFLVTFAGFLSMVPYRLVNLAVLSLLILLALIFDGLPGLLALTASSIVGYLAVLLGVKRTNCMGALMIPLLLR